MSVVDNLFLIHYILQKFNIFYQTCLNVSNDFFILAQMNIEISENMESLLLLSNF